MKVFRETSVPAALAAGIFHRNEVCIAAIVDIHILIYSLKITDNLIVTITSLNLLFQVRIQDVKEHLRTEGVPYRSSAPVVAEETVDSGSTKKARL